MVKYFWRFRLRQNTFSQNTRKKFDKTKIINAKDINDAVVKNLNELDCLIIDSFDNNINEKLFYTILNLVV